MPYQTPAVTAQQDASQPSETHSTVARRFMVDCAISTQGSRIDFNEVASLWSLDRYQAMNVHQVLRSFLRHRYGRDNGITGTTDGAVRNTEGILQAVDYIQRRKKNMQVAAPTNEGDALPTLKRTSPMDTEISQGPAQRPRIDEHEIADAVAETVAPETSRPKTWQERLDTVAKDSCLPPIRFTEFAKQKAVTFKMQTYDRKQAVRKALGAEDLNPRSISSQLHAGHSIHEVHLVYCAAKPFVVTFEPAPAGAYDTTNSSSHVRLHHPPRALFHRLPPHVRDSIYNYVWNDATIFLTYTRKKTSRSTQLSNGKVMELPFRDIRVHRSYDGFSNYNNGYRFGLAFTNLGLGVGCRMEAANSIYTIGSFVANSAPAMRSFLAGIGPEKRGMLEKIEIENLHTARTKCMRDILDLLLDTPGETTQLKSFILRSDRIDKLYTLLDVDRSGPGEPGDCSGANRIVDVLYAIAKREYNTPVRFTESHGVRMQDAERAFSREMLKFVVYSTKAMRNESDEGVAWLTKTLEAMVRAKLQGTPPTADETLVPPPDLPPMPRVQ